jgi:hypothetical protein
MGTFWIRVTTHIDGMGTADGLLIFKMMSALFCNSVEYGHALFHNLGAYTVARKNCNL